MFKFIIALAVGLLVFMIHSPAQVTIPIVKQASTPYKFKLREHIVPLSLFIIGGAADGFNQAISFHYDKVKTKLSSINSQYWDPSRSWTNKYKLHDPTKGAKFIGSTGPLVFVTDGYHLTRFINDLTTVGAITVKITQQKRKWYIYVLEAAGYWILNRTAFALTYNSF